MRGSGVRRAAFGLMARLSAPATAGTDPPVKCPVAPLEFAFLADWYFQADLVFTFSGLDAITKKRYEHIRLATVGNPGLHLPTVLGGLPGVPGLITRYTGRKMEKLDIPPIPEFIEMISDTGAGIYACKAAVDRFELDKDDLIEQVQGITVGEFYDVAAGGQIIYT
ncbi:DsrE/DsrF/DrsH-like family protein [Streptomyces sp. NPDC019531]|uniref:DsrE/DsrF/DrsH-like family protein n=1 Tax=Streptomyces sp. NPDC019531 TaxID=3365062 RepID=UPI0038505895